MDSWETLTFILTHDPTLGALIPDSAEMRAYIVEGSKIIGLPTLKVIYVFDDHNITILKAVFSDAKHHHAGHG